MNTKSTEEGFEDSSETSTVSETESQVRPFLDALAFYNSPGGTLPGSGKTDGEELCAIFQQLRVNMAQSIIGQQKSSDILYAASTAQASGASVNDIYSVAVSANNATTNLTNQEVAKQVEETIANGVPGGSLPCPLLNYPQPGANDTQWLSFLYNIPDDFGARVVLMAMYADSKVGGYSAELDTAMNKKTTDMPQLSSSPSEAFMDICSTDLAIKKRENLREQSCTLPETITPEQFKQAITNKLNTLSRTKDSVLTQNNVNPLTPINPLIVSVKARMQKFNQQIKKLNEIMGP